MPKDEQRQPYERRILDTKGLAQRLDLNYVRRRHWLRTYRGWLALVALIAVAIAVIPPLTGVAGGQKALSPGPLIAGHLAFEKDCWNCHTKAFSRVHDQDCQRCHAESLHHFAAQLLAGTQTPPCASCHEEHHGNRTLVEMADGNCTACHADLSRHGEVVKLLAGSRLITKFANGSHPRFWTETFDDKRPLKLNHSVHMALKASSAHPEMKAPMACADCHQMAPVGSGFDMIPVNYDMHCASCHARDLAFDIDQTLGPGTPPVPHLKDVGKTRESVYNAYRQGLQNVPSLWRRQTEIGKFSALPVSPQAWLDAETNRSMNYLLERKCTLCHELDGLDRNLDTKGNKNMNPTIRKVNQILGQFSAAQPAGVPWFSNALFSHRSHRTTQCGTCHVKARNSTKTSDVLIPTMNTCLPCHGSSGTYLDRCAECHVYHDRSREIARDLRVEQDLLRKFTPIPAATGPERVAR